MNTYVCSRMRSSSSFRSFIATDNAPLLPSRSSHPTDSHNTHGLAGNNQGLASNTHGLTGDNQGLAGNTHALAGNNHGLAGNNHGLTGNNQGLAGNTHGLAGNTHGLSGNSHSSGPAHGLAGHIHDAMCSGRDDDDSQVDSRSSLATLKANLVQTSFADASDLVLQTLSAGRSRPAATLELA